MATGKFVIESNRFDAFDAYLEAGIRQGLANAASTGAAQARTVNKKGYRIDTIVGSGSVGKVATGSRGLEVSIVWTDFRAIFFEKGTYQNRRGKLKRARGSDRGNKGVKPIRFMLAARKAGAERLLDDIHDAMGPG